MTEQVKVEVAQEEPPRGFAVTVQQIDDGVLHSDLSKEMQELVAELVSQAKRYETKAKGTLTLTISMTAEQNGVVMVAGDIKVKTPKIKPAPSHFWATKGGNLSVSNPKQPSLFVRDVSAPAPVREVDEAKPAVRTL